MSISLWLHWCVIMTWSSPLELEAGAWIEATRGHSAPAASVHWPGLLQVMPPSRGVLWVRYSWKENLHNMYEVKRKYLIFLKKFNYVCTKVFCRWKPLNIPQWWATDGNSSGNVAWPGFAPPSLPPHPPPLSPLSPLSWLWLWLLPSQASARTWVSCDSTLWVRSKVNKGRKEERKPKQEDLHKWVIKIDVVMLMTVFGVFYM